MNSREQSVYAPYGKWSRLMVLIEAMMIGNLRKSVRASTGHLCIGIKVLEHNFKPILLKFANRSQTSVTNYLKRTGRTASTTIYRQLPLFTMTSASSPNRWDTRAKPENGKSYQPYSPSFYSITLFKSYHDIQV